MTTKKKSTRKRISNIYKAGELENHAKAALKAKSVLGYCKKNKINYGHVMTAIKKAQKSKLAVQKKKSTVSNNIITPKLDLSNNTIQCIINNQKVTAKFTQVVIENV